MTAEQSSGKGKFFQKIAPLFLTLTEGNGMLKTKASLGLSLYSYRFGGFLWNS